MCYLPFKPRGREGAAQQELESWGFSFFAAVIIFFALLPEAAAAGIW